MGLFFYIWLNSAFFIFKYNSFDYSYFLSILFKNKHVVIFDYTPFSGVFLFRRYFIYQIQKNTVKQANFKDYKIINI